MSTVPVQTTEKTSEEEAAVKNAPPTQHISSSAMLLKNTHCAVVQNNCEHCTPTSTSLVMKKNQTVSSTLQDQKVTQQKSCEDNTKASISQATNVIFIDDDESKFDELFLQNNKNLICCTNFSPSLNIQGKKSDHW